MVRHDRQSHSLEVSFSLSQEWFEDAVRTILCNFTDEYSESTDEIARTAVSKVSIFDVKTLDMDGMMNEIALKMLDKESNEHVEEYHQLVRNCIGEYLDRIVFKDYPEFPEKYVYTIKDFA